MDDIRSWWEVPCIAHFCHIFQKAFKLPDFEIEELEDALLLDHNPTPSSLLVQLFCNLLNGIVDRNIVEDNWAFFLKLHLEWRCEYLSEKWNPMQGEREYKDLLIRERVEILHRLCHWRMELDDVADLLRGIDGCSLRVTTLGRDTEGFTYWYFYGTRLYKEAPKAKSRRKKKDEIAVTPTPGKKGRGRGGVKTPGTPTPGQRKKGSNKQEADEEEEEEEGSILGRRGKGRKSRGGENTPASIGRRTRGQRGKEEIEKQLPDEQDDVESPLPDAASVDDAPSESAVNGEASAGTPASSTANTVTNGTPPPDTGWSVVCSTQEEWEELIESLEGSRQLEPRRLHHVLVELLPEVEEQLQVREKQFRLKMLAEMPRRTSDRIALKAAQKAEQERLDALEREFQREEMRRQLAEEVRKRDEEAEEKRQKKRDEAMRKRKVREEEQERVRKEEEENWSKALSGELSGPRPAALGAAESVTANVVGEVPEYLRIEEERDEDMYTAMFKILSGLRKNEDGWVFEDPVTEAIAPGYFDVIDKPMDYCTVEKKLEASQYKNKQEFNDDMNLIFDNCCEYNGEGSEYYEVAEDMRKVLKQLTKLHFTGEQEPVVRQKKRESRSPSACKTPELTSESSSDESDSGSDQSFELGKSRKPKGKALKLPPELERKLLPQMMSHSGPPPRPIFPPHHTQPPPHYYHHYMRQMQQAHMGHPMPPDMAYHPPYAPRMPPPYPGPPLTMHEGPPGLYPGYPPPNHHYLPHPHMPAYRAPYPPHPMHGHMMPHPHAPSPGMMPHPHAPSPGMMPHPQAPSPGMMPHPQASSPGMMSHPHAPSPGMMPHPQAPSSGMMQRQPMAQQSPSPSLAPRQSESPSTASGSPAAMKLQPPAAMSPAPPAGKVSGAGKDGDGESSQREETHEELEDKPESPSLPDRDQHPPAREESGEQHPPARRERGDQHSVVQEEKGDQHPPARGESGEQHPPARGEKGDQHSVVQEEKGDQHPPARGERGEQHPPARVERGGQHPPARGERGGQHPPARGERGEQHPLARGERGDQCSVVQEEKGEQHPPARGESEGEGKQVPSGYGHPSQAQAYDIGRQAAYRYAMAAAMQQRHPSPHDPYPQYPHPHGYDHPPVYPPHQREEAYYAWQQQQAYWQEMERRRRHHYAMMQQQQQQERRRKREEGVPPDVGNGEKKAASSAGDIPDYQDSLRRYALGLAENKGQEGEISGAEKEEKRKEEEREKGKEVGEAISRPPQTDSKPQLQRPPRPYPPHMMHSGMQNGYPSDADMARMHSPYPPPPPHAYPPPPYGPRQLDPQHRNGMPSSASHHPGYPPYYAHPHHMPYGPPHPYMPEHGAMTAEQVERWRAEEMKRQQLAAMHGYPSPYPPSMHHPPAPTQQPQKHTLQPSKQEGEEPATKRRRTSDS